MPKDFIIANARQIQRNYKALFEEVKKKKKPLFVMKGTEPEVVILDPKTYDKLIEARESAPDNYPTKISPYKARVPWRKTDLLS